MFNLCEECDRLWREFAAVTFEHIRAEDRLKRAVLEHDAERIAQLMPISEAAAAARTLARLAIRQHETSAHPAKASPTGPEPE